MKPHAEADIEIGERYKPTVERRAGGCWLLRGGRLRSGGRRRVKKWQSSLCRIRRAREHSTNAQMRKSMTMLRARSAVRGRRGSR